MVLSLLKVQALAKPQITTAARIKYFMDGPPYSRVR
jgi:hypothetical protein